MKMTPESIFVSKIDKRENGCWIWTGPLDKDGYGRFSDRHKNCIAHRWSYEHFVGEIPRGLTIDHLCRNRACVNPIHLEPVTLRENILRGETKAARLYRVTHCPKGHLYDLINTYYNKKNGHRQCRECIRQRGIGRSHKKKLS